MILSISAVLLFGVASFFAVRSRATSGGAALVVFLFGFYAAATGAAGPINEFMASAAHTLAQMRG
ncbi:hypothetical protein [Actinacidiphila acidipaludis]|uniref:Uncharacterized protein n=1 Tax=Actinacidiphila acidipaludis TaxID=2873382 RepID=A0ABS7Q3E0_9ACTN|nr:hypothetical protein [Streptomyces acidipaludis]MBY8877473.1 hypothetical protein [Streptomyces acidipaludis]